MLWTPHVGWASYEHAAELKSWHHTIHKIQFNLIPHSAWSLYRSPTSPVAGHPLTHTRSLFNCTISAAICEEYICVFVTYNIKLLVTYVVIYSSSQCYIGHLMVNSSFYLETKQNSVKTAVFLWLLSLIRFVCLLYVSWNLPSEYRFNYLILFFWCIGLVIIYTYQHIHTNCIKLQVTHQQKPLLQVSVINHHPQGDTNKNI